MTLGYETVKPSCSQTFRIVFFSQAFISPVNVMCLTSGVFCSEVKMKVVEGYTEFVYKVVQI